MKGDRDGERWSVMATNEKVPLTGRSGFDGGERVAMGGNLTPTQQEHLARYNWAAGQIGGDVLDAACGTGYGTAILARTARTVTGLDGSKAALEAARVAAPGATLTQAVLPGLPYENDGFDAVVSFETIEHLEDGPAFLGEIRRVLRDGGRLLLSTPNKEITSPTGPPTNPWHVREYLLGELRAMLVDAGFDQLATFGQCPLPRTAIERTARRVVARFPQLRQPGRWWDTLAYSDARVIPWKEGAFDPIYWVIRAEAT